MAYYHARSGICRSGVTHCGWTPPLVKAYIGGVDRTASILRDAFTITNRADGQPPTFHFTTKTITPTVGQDVTVLYATPDDYLFAGTLLQVEAHPTGPGSSFLEWHCMAVGYQWLLDRYDRVLAQYRSTGVGTMVADILDRFTNGGFRIGYIPSSLGNLDMTFTYETVTGALNRIAKAVDAFWEVTPTKVVNLSVTPAEASLATLTEAAVLKGSLAYRSDLTQVRTREIYQAQGTTVSAAVSSGASTIPVQDTAIFLSAGGSARSGRSLLTYTGRSTNRGAGDLTGVSGLLDDLAVNDEIAVVVITTDATATTALATLLGGGLSGQATHHLADGRLSAAEAEARSDTDLSIFGGALTDVDFTYKAVQRHVKVGRMLTISISNPLAISGSFRIQSLSIAPRGALGSSNIEIFQSVSTSGYTRALTDLLKQLAG